MTSTLASGASSPRRLEPAIVLWRSRLYDGSGVELLAVVERDVYRSLIVSACCRPTTVLAAGCGAMLSFS